MTTRPEPDPTGPIDTPIRRSVSKLLFLLFELIYSSFLLLIFVFLSKWI
jgi:hypothetical protein